MVRLISIGWGNVSRVMELEEKDGKFFGTSSEYSHGGTAPAVRVNHIGSSEEFSSIERAMDSLSMWTDHGPVFREEEQIARCQALFPQGIDVVEKYVGEAIALTIAYRPKGFDVVWREGNEAKNISAERALLIRIPENGEVRCPERFMGRVIGKKGVKVSELSKKHGVSIQLIPITDKK